MTFKAAVYAAGYCVKKLYATEDDEYYTRVEPTTGELFDVHPSFGTMSRNPALGRSYLERHWRDVYPRDFVVCEGREFKPPRYYDKWMDFPDSKGGTSERRQIMEEVRYQRWQDAEQIGDPELILREKVHRHKHEFFNTGDKL